MANDNIFVIMQPLHMLRNKKKYTNTVWFYFRVG